MKQDCLMVTNNSKANGKYWGQFQMEYLEDQDYLAVLEKARDYIHAGWRLLSHPMCGSLKPNQTPYKSILLSKEGEGGGVRYEDVLMIENSIAAYHKFQKGRPTPCWTERVKEDFKTIDLSIIDSAAVRIS